MPGNSQRRGAGGNKAGKFAGKGSAAGSGGRVRRGLRGRGPTPGRRTGPTTRPTRTSSSGPPSSRAVPVLVGPARGPDRGRVPEEPARSG
ncbi:Uncharacterised protein [Acidipropionibacterium jensenii]|uniref:Uncharacterized protein n=1 Tax=Acidipropionibacterium jensenii TaxID=1749 RepID=A0A3S4UT64_9ACTN|nr:Uncharacterised protein [Acidipropionibacterium jensenii]